MAIKKGVGITDEEVGHIAKLANLVLKPGEEKKFTGQFAETLKTVAVINELDTTNIEPTSQVTGLANVTREDIVDTTRILPRDEVLKQSPESHNGYIVVPAIL
jgi:aspartyl-tRNA(Asn)/glutamyl-tRNA(Gln) amidotransferase subunit C